MVSYTRVTLLPAQVTVGLRVVSQHVCVVIIAGFLLAAIAIYVNGKHRHVIVPLYSPVHDDFEVQVSLNNMHPVFSK